MNYVDTLDQFMKVRLIKDWTLNVERIIDGKYEFKPYHVQSSNIVVKVVPRQEHVQNSYSKLASVIE